MRLVSKLHYPNPGLPGEKGPPLGVAPWIHGVEFGQEDIFSPRSKESSDMLVLSRKLGEKIVIGENICITVVDIDRGKIRLGIEAPRDVPIYRQELLPLNHPRPDAPAPTAAAS